MGLIWFLFEFESSAIPQLRAALIIIRSGQLQVIRIKIFLNNPDMRSFAFATVLAAANAVSQIELDYLNHCAKFARQHDTMAQFEMRLARFAKVDAFIKESNSANWSHTAASP